MKHFAGLFQLSQCLSTKCFTPASEGQEGHNDQTDWDTTFHKGLKRLLPIFLQQFIKDAADFKGVIEDHTICGQMVVLGLMLDDALVTATLALGREEGSSRGLSLSLLLDLCLLLHPEQLALLRAIKSLYLYREALSVRFNRLWLLKKPSKFWMGFSNLTR